MADVQKSAFSLSSATLMMAPAFTTDVFSLTPSANSVGMVSEVNVSVDSSVTELLNGVAQVTVDSRKTGVKAAISANVFEMTAANFMRAQSLASSTPISVKRGKLTAIAAAGAVSLTVSSYPVPGEASSAISTLGDIPAGSTLLIQRESTGEIDYVFPTMSSGATTGTGPFVIPIASPYVIPANMSFAVNDTVWIVSPISIASSIDDELFGVKITGSLTNFNRPVTVVFPKVRISKGFTIAFNETQYSSMPWELQPIILSAGEISGRLSEIGTKRPGLVYVGA